MEEQGKTARIPVYADYREEKSGIPSMLEASGIPVIRENLSVGDYLVSNEIVIERKSAYDFAHSLFDGRLFDQAKRLSESYPLVIYIIEGDPTRIRRYRSRQKQILSAMVSLSIEYGARLLYSDSPVQTAYIIEAIVRRVEKSGRAPVVMHKKPKIGDIRSWQLYIIQSFPNIGPKTAERILEYYGTIKAFCNTSLSELSRIDGIGEKKAENIIKILNIKYKYGVSKKEAKNRTRRLTLEDFTTTRDEENND